MGRLEPITVILGADVPCRLRSAEIADAPAILAYRRAQIGTHDFEINLPEEFDADPARQREIIQESLDRPNWIYIIALGAAPGADAGRVIGGLLFRGQPKHRMRHHGTFGIAVDPAWRGRGVGRAMIEALLAWAAEHPFLEKVCLFCFATNAGAQRLYRSMGFVEEGRTVRHFRTAPGAYIDDIAMSIFVKPGVAPQGFNTWPGRAVAARTPASGAHAS